MIARPCFVRVSLHLLLSVVIVCGVVPSAAVGIELTSAPIIKPPAVGLLARVLDFSTDVPTRMSFQVHAPGEAWIVESDVLRTEHSIPVFGLTFATNYTLDNLTLTNADGDALTWNDALSITTAPAPANAALVNVLTSQPERMEPGYTLFPAGGGHTLGVDAHGTPRWHFAGSIPDIHQAANGLFLGRVNQVIREMDLLGVLHRAWYATGFAPDRIPSIAVPVESTRFHHDVALIESSGNILTLLQSRHDIEDFPLSVTDPNGPTGTMQIVSDVIVEITTDGTIVHSWDLVDVLDPRRSGYGVLNQAQTLADWSHSNAVLHDPRDDSLIVSVRNQDAVIKIDRTTGDLKWILGPHEGWEPEWQPYLLTPVGEDFEWPYHTHSPEVLPNGNLLLHDNGNFRARPFDPPMELAERYTRAVEYAIDEQTMEIMQVWQYGKDAETVMFSPTRGDADWLPQTDNILITIADPSYINGEIQMPRSARILEVDRDGNVVLDLQISDPEGMSNLPVYRAERIPSLYGPEYTMTMLAVILPQGDYNGNGQVEQADLDLVLLNWGEDGTVPPTGWNHDLPSGAIDQEELDRVLLNWGALSTIAAVTTPEPASWVVGIVAAMVAGCLSIRQRK